MWPVTVRSIDHFKVHVAPRGTVFQACNGTWLFWGTTQLLSTSPVTIHTLDSSTYRWVLCVCERGRGTGYHVWACTHLLSISHHEHWWSQRLAAVLTQSLPFLTLFLPPFFSLTRSVYVPPLASLKCVCISPRGSLPSQQAYNISHILPALPPSLPPRPRSAIDDISRRHLLGDLSRPFLCEATYSGCTLLFRQYMRIIRELKSPTATIFSKGAISHLSTSAPPAPLPSPPPPPLFSATLPSSSRSQASKGL